MIGLLGKPSASRLGYVLALLAVAAGVGLRVISFGWNDRLHGDVNLFALTAREFAEHGRLYYPMKYEYTDHVEYLAMATPATQHPPLWPFVGGLVAKLFRTDDTFTVLKSLSMLTGLALLGFAFLWGRLCRQSTDVVIVLLLLASVSPMLVDFSANGSFYVLSALFLFLSGWVLHVFSFDKTIGYVLAGLLVGLGYQTYGALVCIPISFCVFGVFSYRKLRWKGVAAFFLTATVALMPVVVWNLKHFGTPFYTSTTLHVYGLLGLVDQRVGEEIVQVNRGLSLSEVSDYLHRYSRPLVIYLKNLLRHGIREVGPFELMLAIVGCISSFKRDRRLAVSFLLPLVSYLAVLMGFALYKARYLVPILPIVYLFAALGFAELVRHRRRALHFWGWVLLIAALASMSAAYFEEPPTRYYMNDRQHAALYRSMVPVAEKLGQSGDGTVLGLSATLDGGIEAVYWHRLPFVRGREFLKDADIVKKLVADFDVRYVWADTRTIDRAVAYFPGKPVIISNDKYYVLDLKEPTAEEQLAGATNKLLVIDQTSGFETIEPLKQVVTRAAEDGLEIVASGKDPSVQLLAPPQHPQGELFVIIDITSPEDTTLQLFYLDRNTSRYSDGASVRRALKKGRQTAVLAVRASGLFGPMRLDPGDVPGKYVVHSIEFRNADETVRP